jgi:crotonobetainyl-CoA:carnitine CoA-transferase CaiB-like acyl-CoA transferase
MLPLDDLLVFDLSRVLSGPYCSMYLGDFGARVIKLEHPHEGDDTRRFGPPFVAGQSTYFLSINRNKESVAIDFKHAAGRKLALDLAARADVLLENFRPGALARLGLDYATLAKVNPRLIYCSVSGFGHAGVPEWTRRPGYDLAIQGMGGLASLTGEEGGTPLKSGVSIADLAAGLYALVGILVALHARGRTGRGQHVDVSMLDGQISLLTYHAGIHFATGAVPSRRGNKHPSIVPYETFRAADGWVNIAVGNDAQFRALCAAVGAPIAQLAADARFATNGARVENREALGAILEPLVAAKPVAHWCELCERAGIPSGPILSVADALAHPQVAARDMVVPLEHPVAGTIRVTGVPVKLSETPGSVRRAPPLLGEHTRAALRELLALSDDALDQLEKDGVIAQPAAAVAARAD